MQAVGGGQRLPRAVSRGQRAGVRRYQRPACLGRAHAEQHGGHVRGQRVGQHRAQAGRVPDRLEDQRQHPGFRQAQRVPGVGRGRGDQLLAGRHSQAEAEAAARPQQRGEHRTRVGDQRDRPRVQVGLDVADGAQAAGDVHEPHAPRAAHGHARLAGDRGQPVPQPGGARKVKGRTENYGRTGVAFCRGVQLCLKGGVGDGEQHQIHRFGQLGQAGQAGHAFDVGVPGVDQVGTRARRAPGHLRDHARAEAARPRAGPDQRHAACLEHRGDGFPGFGGSLGRGRGGWRRLGHLRRGPRRAARRSAIAARAACMPGMPQTPPPAWVAELA